ncbi:MAG TPA: adenylate/guanylate cyclase domain-containing protein, partial [Candidatus Methylomirabilis sp.]
MSALQLVRVRGPQERDQWVLEPGRQILVGRCDPDQGGIDIDLWPDWDVSRSHARIWIEGDACWIEDLNSRNGTLVSGREIKGSGPVRLGPGVDIQMGETVLMLAPPQWDPGETWDPVAELELEDQIAEGMDATLPPFAVPGAGALEDRLAPGGDIQMGETLLMRAPQQWDPGETWDPVPELELEGQITEVMDATIPPFAVPGAGALEDRLAQAQRQLKAFCDLSEAFGTADTPERLLHILAEQLRRAIPRARRGGVVLRGERGELLLKAHWPPGEPSVSTTWVERACAKREAFICTAPAEGPGDPSASVIQYHVQSAIYVPLIWGEEVLGLVYLDNPEAREAFAPGDLEIVRAIANPAALFIKNHALQQDLLREGVVRSNLLRQFSHKIADRLLKERGRLRLGGERADPVTLLVSDVRGFTTLSATMQPDDVVQMLNEMFGVFIPIIFKHDGTVDKYMGDSVLAVFGSPEPDDRQWEKAVGAALEMQRAMQKLGDVLRMRGLPICEIGIGVHTGGVVHGFIGSPERMEYTVIGDAVNRASRYCGGAGPGEIVISKAVY